jgi:hypothetical protein
LILISPSRPSKQAWRARGEFVLDAVIELVQKGSSLQCERMGYGMGHGGLLIDINYTV